jgi:hypothetical protein
MEIVGISALLKAFLQPAVCLIAPTQLAVVIVWLGAIASYETANHTDRVRGGRGLRLPTEPCVRVRTRLLMQGVSIEKRQTNAPACGRIVFPALSG